MMVKVETAVSKSHVEIPTLLRSECAQFSSAQIHVEMSSKPLLPPKGRLLPLPFVASRRESFRDGISLKCQALLFGSVGSQ